MGGALFPRRDEMRTPRSNMASMKAPLDAQNVECGRSNGEIGSSAISISRTTLRRALDPREFFS